MTRIVEVDGQPTRDVDELLRAVSAKKNGEDVRVKHLDLHGAHTTTCVRLDTKHWPTSERRRVSGPRVLGGIEPYHWVRAAV